MNSEKIIPITEKKKVTPKIRIERLAPKDIIDSWRLLEQQLKAEAHFPPIDEDEPQAIRAQLYQYLSRPNTLAFVARVNRRPVAQILADVQLRPFGSPRVFLQIWSAWTDPTFRRQKIMTQLVALVSAQAKAAGVHHWEMMLPNGSEEKPCIVPAKVLAVRFGEKIPLK